MKRVVCSEWKGKSLADNNLGWTRVLVSFTLQNYRSFFSEQSFCFSLRTDNAHDTSPLERTVPRAIPKISRNAIVFGANASGKTNLLAAFATCRDLVFHSMAFSDIEFTARYTPFKLGHDAHGPTIFAIDVLLEGTRYCYSMSYDAQRVRAERLVVHRSGESHRWFDRRYDEATQQEKWLPFSPRFKGPRELWRKATRPTALFLTTAGRLNAEPLAPLLHWMEHGIESVKPSDSSDFTDIARQMQDRQLTARVVQLLRAADLPVTDVRVNNVTLPLEANGARPVGDGQTAELTGPQIEFLHGRAGGRAVWLNSRSEASGTRRLLRLLPPLLAAIDRRRLLLIDEFDTGLHPLIARFLIQLINEPTGPNRGAQVLLTSHNATLLDVNTMPLDSIWLMQLDEAQSSCLAPLLQLNPTRHELLVNGRVHGRGDLPRRSGADYTPSDAAAPTRRVSKRQM